MRITISLFILINSVIVYSQSDISTKYLFIRLWGSESVDTISKTILSNDNQDSIFFVSYKITWRNDTYIERFAFQQYDSMQIKVDSHWKVTEYIDKKSFNLFNRKYEIYKYLEDDPKGVDEEMLYFYSPQYGVLINRSLAWGNFDKLIDWGNEEDNLIISILCDMILGDTYFFHKLK
jgi:hypothetical protein